MDIALVGVVLPGAENHSLAALDRAVTDAGFACGIVPFRGFAGMGEMLRDVLDARPRICGISIQTTESALAGLTFTRLLRERGYRGKIVVGGHYASIAANE